MERSRISLCGAEIDVLTERQCIDWIIESLEESRGGWVITANLDHLRRQRRDARYRAMLNAAELVVADGMPLVWASHLQRTPLPQRIAGSNLFVSLTHAAAQQGRSVFLLGGNPGAAEAAAAVFRSRFSPIHIAGCHCPPMGFETDERQIDDLIELLGAAKPDIVYVALGSPKQEQLIQRIRHCLPGAWWMGVGISFSFLAGDVRRAPRWMQSIGLEWLHRLVQEPMRLGRRYLVHGIPFALSLLATSVLKGAMGLGESAAAVGTGGTTSPAPVSPRPR